MSKISVSENLAVNIEKLIADLGFKGKKILLVSDERIFANSARFFKGNLDKVVSKKLILKAPKADEKNLKKIAAAAKNHDLILALGSGTINDLCKYTSAQSQIPYAVFASAASMNGYLSKNASITISGHKKTLAATLPLAVFCDLKILKAAPLELTKAGIGDSLCFYSCWFDWYLSHKILGTKFDKKPFEMLKKKMEFFVNNFEKFSAQNEEFLKLLIEILLISGQAMTIVGGSYPASQSEHLIAHTIEMKYPELAGRNLHGAEIAVTTLTAARLQKNILESESIVSFYRNSSSLRTSEQEDLMSFNSKPKLMRSSSLRAKDDEFGIEKNMASFFGKKIAKECQKEYEQKLQTIKESGKIKLSTKAKKDLEKIHLDESHLKSIFSHFKIKTSPKSLGLSNSQYQECVMHAKFIRNRFTCLDLVKSEDDDGSIEQTLHLLSSSKNRKHLLSAIKNEGKGKSVTFKSKTEMKKFFIKL